MNNEYTELINLISKSLISQLLTKTIIPHLNSELTKKFKHEELTTLIESINYYSAQKEAKYSIIDTIVFPNQQTLFESIYQPLTLVVQDINKTKISSILVDKYPLDFIDTYQRIIIVDTAGMGKSTVTKKIFLSAIKEQTKVPIYIEVRNLSKENNIQNEILKQLEADNKFKVSPKLLDWFLLESNCIYIFDGLDEISANNREDVVNQLHDFIEKHGNTEILMTSRPEDITLSFGSFIKAHIKPLTIEESKELIERYDKCSYNKIAKDLILTIDAKGNDDIHTFMKVPFLLSLIYKCFEFKKDIPLKKSLFYKQVYDALFEAHDLSKQGYFVREKLSKLSLDEFDRTLRHVAYFSAQQNEVEYSNDRILKYIDEAKEYMGDLRFESTKFLQDLLNTVPLFRQDGLNVKWAHKSIQDYFAAKFIWIDTKEEQSEILKTIYDSENAIQNRINMIDLYEELDPKGFNMTILYWFLQEFKDFYDNKSEEINTNSKLLNDIYKSFSFYSTLVFAKSELLHNSKNQQDFHDYVGEEGIDKNLYYIRPLDLQQGHYEAHCFANRRLISLQYLVSKKKLGLTYSYKVKTAEEHKTIVAVNKDYFTLKELIELNSNISDIETLISIVSVERTLIYENCIKKLYEIEALLDNKLKKKLLKW